MMSGSAGIVVGLFMISAVATAAARDQGGDVVEIVMARPPATDRNQQPLAAASRAAVDAGIPREDVDAIIEAGRSRGIPAESVTGLLDIAVAVKRQGLPMRPVLDRIEQGLAKGIPVARVESAAQRLAGHLASARPLIDGMERKGLRAVRQSEKEQALSAAARALEQGISPNGITLIGDAVRKREQPLSLLAEALDAAATLAAGGADAPTAERRVGEAVSAGRPMGDLMSGAAGKELKPKDDDDAGARSSRPDTSREKEKFDHRELKRDRGHGSDRGGRGR